MNSLTKFNIFVFASISIIIISCSSCVSFQRSNIKIHSIAYHTWPVMKNGLSTITGFATTDDNAEASGTNIELLNVRDSLLYEAVVGPDNTYKIVNIPPGLYTIKASLIGYKKTTLNNLDIKANAIIHIEVNLTTEVIIIE